jgi:hypothetical protein
MLSFENDLLLGEKDIERRRELKAFLLQRRAQIDPVELGLPSTTRRQVSGLRRGEVAELIGVTADWYRSFESGRPVRVSPRVISRLVNAFRLGVSDALTLYSLAIPEIYVVTSAARTFSDQMI